MHTLITTLTDTRGANIKAEYNRGKKPYELDEEPDADGNTVLHMLVRGGDRIKAVTAHLKKTKKLARNVADNLAIAIINAVYNLKQTPLH